MPDFAANLDPTALGLPSKADLDAAFRATPGYEAMAKAEAEKQARIAAYKAANPGASDFAARYYGGTDEDRARIQAMYPGTFGKLHKSMYYSGAAPAEGQSVLDYMLANNGAMPETKVKEGPGLGQALLTAAMLAAGGYGFGTLMNGLMAGGLAGGGALSGGGGVNALFGGAGADVLAPTISELVITGGASGMTVPQIAAAVGIPAFAVSNVLQNAAGSGVLQNAAGSDVLQGGEAGDTLNQPGDGTTIDELVITADKLNPATWTDLGPVGVLNSAMFAKDIANGLDADLKPVDQFDPKQIAEGVEKGVGYETPLSGELFTDTIVGQTIPSNVEGLKTTAEALGPGSPAGKLAEGTLADKALDWVKAHPFEVARLGLTLAGGVAGAASGAGKTGPSSLPSGVLDAGQPGSTSDIFRAKLPPPSGPFADMSARDVNLTPEQWATYGQRGQMAFLNSTPVRPSGIIDTSKRAPVNPGLNPAEAEPGFKAKVTPDVQVAPGYWPEPNSPTQPVSGANQPYDPRADVQVAPGYWPEPNSPTQPVSGANQPYDPRADERAYWEAQARQRAEREGRPYVPARNGKTLAMERLGGAPTTTPTSTSPGFNPSAVIPDYLGGEGFNRPAPRTKAPFAVALDKLRDRQAPPMPKPSIEPKFAKGGFAVRGPGTGRSDDIPARLSDGEYVIDAETVALLGDGSTKAGAERLDHFRVNIRKHKGKKLAKGAFSVNAKAPEAYLRGGRT